jgi:23S rRNA (guanosine2251-2'-O)-methyltransferase
MGLEFDLIFGLHSIAEALKNTRRVHQTMVATDEGLSELVKKHKIQPRDYNVKIEIVSSHLLQEKGKKLCQYLGVEFTRVPSQIFLQTSPLETYTLKEFLGAPKIKILALDQITDVHNGAAIMRTACFYGVDVILIPGAKSFGLTPSFYRIASGAIEHINLVRVSSLSKAIGQLNEAGIKTIGLSEHSSGNVERGKVGDKICLVLGAEETGMSHAVARLVQENLSLSALGAIKSLNVSAAAAVAMEKCFGE